MIVDSIKKKSKGKYLITIEGKEYTLFENIVVEYRMIEGHETSEAEIKEALASNELEEYYSKALNYALRYSKCEAEVKDYLLNKGVSYQGSMAIIARLKKNKALQDDKLIDSLIYSFMKNGNGKAMIAFKLKGKGFKKDVIDSHLAMIDYDDYIDSLKNLYKKIEHKYDKDEPNIRLLKIKRYLFQRGYSTNDVECIGL